MSKSIDFRHISLYQSPADSPGYLLWKVSTRWRSTITDVLKQFNLTHPQFVVLATLSWLIKDGKKVSQIDVAKMAALDPNTTSQVLRGLEVKKLIKRIQSVDERSKNPSVTLLGGQVLTHALPAVEQADAQFFAQLQKDELFSLVQVLQQLMVE